AKVMERERKGHRREDIRSVGEESECGSGGHASHAVADYAGDRLTGCGKHEGIGEDQGISMKGWATRKLGDLLDIQNGFAFDSKKFDSSAGVPLIRIRDLRGG